ncbi:MULTISPECIES: EamA family transporter [Microbacterium]|uniref:EamA family transporter n=1 Tax=Microbacterium TaxID=33882 RepID=UPI0006F7D557|nr:MULTISPECIES: DMT family transporter [Microbacterium]KQR25392.1 multidrug DMT transporter permease [Microbacterium sp. Leaf151]MCI9857967.1 DMT family transporter [Microbacterium proteolyticum]
MTTSSLTLPRATRHGSGAVTGLLIAVSSALAFSSSGPFVKPLLDGGWSLGTVLLVRMGVAALLLSPALVLAIRRQPGFLRRHGLLILAFGLTAVAGCQLFYFAAMQRMPVAVALLIQYIAPVLLVLAVWVRTRRAPSRAVLIGSVVAMAGLVLVVDISGARFDLLGTVFALCAAVCAAAYFVIAGRAGDDLPPLALAAGGLLTGTLVMALLVGSGILPFAAPSITVSLAGFEVPGILPLLWVGAVATTLGYALGVIAVPLIGSRLASFVGLSEVLFALGFAWLLLGEAPAPIQFVGGALVLVGVVLVKMDAGSPAEQKTETASIAVVPAP